MLTVADGPALGIIADTMAEYIAAREAIRENGATYEKRRRVRSALKRPTPEVAIAQAARRDTSRMLESFGLTPASRSRVTLDPERKQEAADSEGDRIEHA